MAIEFINRNLKRRAEDFKEVARRRLDKILAEQAARGMLESGNTLIRLRDEFQAVLREHFSDAAKFAFNAHGKMDEALVGEMKAHLQTIEDCVLQMMRERAHNTGLKDATLDPFFNTTTAAVKSVSERLLDDFAFGMIGSDKLTSDPVVSVINNQTNSPGAILQVGMGNANLQASIHNKTELLDALQRFLESDAVIHIEARNRVAIHDVAETIIDEVQKEKPEASKLRRWCDRLIAIGTEAGIRSSMNEVIQAIVKALGG